jgi:hypothetical protein
MFSWQKEIIVPVTPAPWKKLFYIFNFINFWILSFICFLWLILSRVPISWVSSLSLTHYSTWGSTNEVHKYTALAVPYRVWRVLFHCHFPGVLQLQYWFLLSLGGCSSIVIVLLNFQLLGHCGIHKVYRITVQRAQNQQCVRWDITNTSEVHFVVFP